MMDLVTLCSLPAKAYLQTAPTGPILVAVVKATYVLEPGVCPLAEHQEPIADQDEHLGGDRTASLRVPSDLVPYKPRADVLVVGSARAPGGAPVAGLVARLIVGDVDKVVRVVDDGRWPAEGTIAPRLGAEAFEGAARLNVAPPDQQVEELRPDERIILEHLHPRHARLTTNLPGHRVRAVVESPGCPPFELPMRADTLWIDADRGVCTVTWRGALDLGGGERGGRIVVCVEEASGAGPATSSVPPPKPVLAPAPAPPVRAASEPPSPWQSGATDPSRGPRAPAHAPAKDAAAASDEAVRAALPARSIPTPAPPAVVDLLWYDDALPGRLRTRASWASLLAERALARALGNDDGETEEAAALSSLLERGRADDLDGSGAPAASPDRSPLLLVAGQLRLVFDGVDWLRTAVQIARAFAGTDPRLRDAVAAAEAHLAMPGLRGFPALVDRLKKALSEAFAAAPGAWSPTFLPACCEQALLDERAYPRRRILGGTWLRASLAGPGAWECVPTYLPEALAPLLPLLPALEVRLIAQLVARQDALEAPPWALRVLAFGRVS